MCIKTLMLVAYLTKMLLKTLLIITLLSIVDLRHIRLLNRKRKHKLNDKLFHKLEPTDREYLDDIIHFRSGDKAYSDWTKIVDIEDDFKRCFAMEGIKYIYKRDLVWRTRRKVVDSNGVQRMISYKCNNLFVRNTTGCQNCGSWTIEESPPCPYEFYSLIDNDKMCGYNYLHDEDFKSNCPSIIRFSDLPPSCDNPMETTWRFTTEYTSSKKYSKIICDGKDYCEIFTTYFITPTNVIFRMINTTNDVIYSRIMKPNNVSYVCINDCGHYDPHTKKVTKLDTPKRLNLLSSNKNKRDLTNFKDDSMATSSLIKRQLNITKRKLRFIDKNVDHLYSKTTVQEDYLSNLISKETTTMSSCKRLQKKAKINQDYENYDY